MMCMQALKSHTSVHVWLGTFLPPGKRMEEWDQRKKQRALNSPQFPAAIVSTCVSESEPFTGSQAEWRSRAERHRSPTTLTGAIG